MNKRFDDDLLLEFMQTFYGYGSYSSPIWFVGMEQGGGDTFDEASRRLDVWARRGRPELDDVVEYHRELGITWPFTERPKLQPTWSKLIRILLSFQGTTPDTDTVRSHQARRWARTNGGECLLELLPLPSPSTRHWLYAQHSSLPDLVDRETYREAWAGPRIEGLRRRIQEHQPAVVVLYSFSYLRYWRQIAQAEFERIATPEIYTHCTGKTLLAVVKHPVATGVTTEYFHQVGRYLASQSLKSR